MTAETIFYGPTFGSMGGGGENNISVHLQMLFL